MHLTTVFEFCLPLYLNYDSCLCIKSIGVVWYHSCIKIDLHVYPCNPISLWLALSNVVLR
jgi:hypothetical protein